MFWKYEGQEGKIGHWWIPVEEGGHKESVKGDEYSRCNVFCIQA
jgi:hypothetical protein